MIVLCLRPILLPFRGIVTENVHKLHLGLGVRGTARDHVNLLVFRPSSVSCQSKCHVTVPSRITQAARLRLNWRTIVSPPPVMLS